MPGFVDPHTHLCYAGERWEEFATRRSGADYLADEVETCLTPTEKLIDTKPPKFISKKAKNRGPYIKAAPFILLPSIGEVIENNSSEKSTINTFYVQSLNLRYLVKEFINSAKKAKNMINK